MVSRPMSSSATPRLPAEILWTSTGEKLPGDGAGRSLFFLCQGEDGIRCFHVTGVQTCALPIFGGVDRRQLLERRLLPVVVDLHPVEQGRRRSEERRVGKECRYRWSPDHKKNKKTSSEKAAVSGSAAITKRARSASLRSS